MLSKNNIAALVGMLCKNNLGTIFVVFLASLHRMMLCNCHLGVCQLTCCIFVHFQHWIHESCMTIAIWSNFGLLNTVRKTKSTVKCSRTFTHSFFQSCWKKELLDANNIFVYYPYHYIKEHCIIFCSEKIFGADWSFSWITTNSK